MADFNTHVSIAALVSTLGASLLMNEQIVTPTEALLLTVSGALGGIAPDLDLDTGKALGTLAGILYLLAGFGVMLSMGSGHAVWQLWLGILAGLLTVKYAVVPAFRNWTRHRGIFHSLLAALFFWFAGTNLAAHAFSLPALLAWLVGCFVFIGYVTHLLLDECYSVNFSGRRLKKSWGTAFKLASFGDPRGIRNSILFIITTWAAYTLTPDQRPFINTLAAVGSKTYAALARTLSGWT